MPEVRATTSFYDVATKQVRNVGDEWNCEHERAMNLAAYGLVEVIGMPAFMLEQETEPEPEPEQAEEQQAPVEEAPKRKRKKKA